MLDPFSQAQLLAAGPGFALPREVAFQDIDAAGIVFFPRFLAYMHDAYVAWLAAAGCPLPQVIREGVWIAPIASVQADFLRPLRFGDAVDLRVVAAARGRSSYRLGYRIDRGAEPIATGQTSHVVISEGRPVPVPEALARAIDGLQRP